MSSKSVSIISSSYDSDNEFEHVLHNDSVFQLPDKDKFMRFLTLGSNGNNFRVDEKCDYVSELKNNKLSFIMNLLINNHWDYFHILLDFKLKKKCKKEEPMIFCLSLAAMFNLNKPEQLIFRKYVYGQLNTFCTFPTNLNLFIDYCKKISSYLNGSTGWNKLHKEALNNWYNRLSTMDLAHQLTKYKNRHGYTHRDIFRLLHPVPITAEQNLLYKYIVKGVIIDPVQGQTEQLYEFLKDLQSLNSMTQTDANVQSVVALINKHSFAREHIPTHFLESPVIWKALIVNNLPYTALLRNLNKINKLRLFEDDIVKKIVLAKISHVNVHPIQLLIALKMYARGFGDKGNLIWQPDQDIVHALNKKFLDIPVTQQSNTKICCALDISGSMHGGKIFGADCLEPVEVVTAMAMIMKKKYGDNVDIMGFSDNFIPLNISPHRSLEDNMNAIKYLPFGHTDISVPFNWASKRNKTYDHFIVMTDNETNSNNIPPMHALIHYREKMNVPNCGLVVLATSSNDISVGDPNDEFTLNISGFDESVPVIIDDFIAKVNRINTYF